jgi:hypothetical protein
MRQDNDGVQYIKVAGFPPPAGTFEPEELWVRIVEGDEREGLGRIVNRPLFSRAVKYGDQIEYIEGDGENLPRFDCIETRASELTPIARSTPATHPAGVVPRRVTSGAPANPVKGSRYATKYGQEFEYDGFNWIPLPPRGEPAPVPVGPQPTRVTRAIKKTQPNPVPPMPAPAPKPEPPKPVMLSIIESEAPPAPPVLPKISAREQRYREAEAEVQNQGADTEDDGNPSASNG